MGAFSVARVDPRIKELQIKDSEWVILRRSELPRVGDYMYLSWTREKWMITDNGSIVTRQVVDRESPLFKRTANYYNVRRAINKVRAEALTSMTR